MGILDQTPASAEFVLRARGGRPHSRERSGQSGGRRDYALAWVSTRSGRDGGIVGVDWGGCPQPTEDKASTGVLLENSEASSQIKNKGKKKNTEGPGRAGLTKKVARAARARQRKEVAVVAN